MRVATAPGIALLLGLSLFSMNAQVKMTREEALRNAFPGASVDRRTIFLTEEEARRIQTAAQAKVESKILTYYVARRDGMLDGVAFFETSIVRSMPATYMVVVDPDSSVRMVEILAFYEPEDYLPPERWLHQFAGRKTNDDLTLKRGIPNISGATLTTMTVVDGARRCRAAFAQVVAAKERR